MNAPACYWLELRGYHPAEAAKTLTQPLLILQGGRDYQVTKIDYDGWVKALSGRRNVTFKLYPGAQPPVHAGHGQEHPAGYAVRGPIPEQVIDDLAAWINTRLSGYQSAGGCGVFTSFATSNSCVLSCASNA